MPELDKFENDNITSRSPLGVSFTNDLRDLGSVGFANWLMDSFGGIEPAPVSGRFHWNGDLLFYETFRRLFWQFELEEINIAREGISIVFEKLNEEKVTYYGLLEIFGVAEILEESKYVTRLAQILSCWMNPASKMFKNEPSSLDDIFSLREILESVYRLLLLSPKELGNSDHKFCLIADWCFRILSERHNSLNRTLFPTFAPMYICSLANELEHEEKFRLKKILRTGNKSIDDVNPEFYEFRSNKYGKEFFPYNIDNLFIIGEQFQDSVGRSPSLEKGIIQLYSEHDPIHEDVPSATKGTSGFASHNDEDLLKAINC